MKRALRPLWLVARTAWLRWLERQMSPSDMRQPELIVERRLLELSK